MNYAAALSRLSGSFNLRQIRLSVRAKAVWWRFFTSFLFFLMLLIADKPNYGFLRPIPISMIDIIWLNAIILCSPAWCERLRHPAPLNDSDQQYNDGDYQ
jgi:hypothetical protein